MDGEPIGRREFLRIGSLFGASMVAGAVPFLEACRSWPVGPVEGGLSPAGSLYVPERRSPDGLVLTARQRVVDVASGARAKVLTFGDGPIGPTIEAWRGQRARIVLQNELDEPTIAHWHGLRPPEEADGHPRFAVGPGGSYAYDFDIEERAGLYWYHSHAHMLTGKQVYLGLAGLFVVRDEEERGLGLPSGERELLLVLQDKNRDGTGHLVYAPAGHQMMEGVLGASPYVNGVELPRLEVDSALYRLRILAAGNARIFRLALSNGSPLVMIGSDGGLLDRSIELPYLDLATGERADVLVNFSGLPSGTRVTLRSLPFTVPAGGPMGGGMGMAGTSAWPQGGGKDLLELVVVREVEEPSRVPAALIPLERLQRSDATAERTFRFDSMMMNHTINGRSFDMDRVDERVPFGATEIWRFINNAPFPHPVHMHAVHFQVIGRVGGRGRVLPWEEGWKDTVLVHPGETVEVIARFDSHRGVFLLHCHNLEHEDMGMMMNFAIG